ncbi:hypothetical protein BDR26DRAFT_857206 [Obelidium mucronatum]|nr:hypothetical protein BDR26DRAFT_857206 [Obelidium mucronatum]
MMAQSLPLLSELQVSPHDKITTLALVMPDANSTNLCLRAMQYLDSLPASGSFRVQAELYQNNPAERTPTTADFEQSGVFSTAEDAKGIVPLRGFLLKDKDQARRKGFLAAAKQAQVLPVLDNAVKLASQDLLHKLVVFTSGDVANARDKHNDLQVVMRTLHSKDIPVVIYHTGSVSPTLDLLQKHGAQLLPLANESRVLQNPFSVSCEIPRPFGLRQDVRMKLGFVLQDVTMYDPRFTYTVKIGGGKYFEPAEFTVPVLAPGNSSSYTDTQTLQFNDHLSQIINDVDLLENIPERFTIHIFKGADPASRILLDCRTVGYLFSFRHILLTFKPITPLVIGFSGSGKSSFINSVKFVTLNDPIPAAQVGGYNAQMTSSLDQLDIGRHTLFDTMGMVTGYSEASYTGDEVEMILTKQMPIGVKWVEMLQFYHNKTSMQFGDRPLTFEVVKKYTENHPQNAIFSPKEINCVLGIVKWDSLNSDAIVSKMEYLSQRFASMNKTVVWAASWVDGREETVEYARLAAKIKFAKVLPLSNFTPKISSHDAFKERSIVRVMMALEIESRSHRPLGGQPQQQQQQQYAPPAHVIPRNVSNPQQNAPAPPMRYRPRTTSRDPNAFRLSSDASLRPSSDSFIEQERGRSPAVAQPQYQPVPQQPRPQQIQPLPGQQQPPIPGAGVPVGPLTGWKVADVKDWVRTLNLSDGYSILQKIDQDQVNGRALFNNARNPGLVLGVVQDRDNQTVKKALVQIMTRKA